MQYFEKYLWWSGDIRVTSQGIITGYGIADGITDIVYRGHLGYIPGFQVYVHYVRCKTELLSSAGNVTFSESFSGYFCISLTCVREGSRLTWVAQRCWPRAALSYPGIPIILQYYTANISDVCTAAAVDTACARGSVLLITYWYTSMSTCKGTVSRNERIGTRMRLT